MSKVIQSSSLKESPDEIYVRDPHTDESLIIDFRDEHAKFTFMVYDDLVDDKKYWVAYDCDNNQIISENKLLEFELYDINSHINIINSREDTSFTDEEYSEENMDKFLRHLETFPSHYNLRKCINLIKRCKSIDSFNNKIEATGRFFRYEKDWYVSFWQNRDQILPFRTKIEDFIKRVKINTDYLSIEDDKYRDFKSYNEYFDINRKSTGTDYDLKLKQMQFDIHLKKGQLDKAIINVIQSKPKNVNDLYQRLEKELHMPIAKIKHVFQDFPLDKLISKKIRETLNEMPVDTFQTIGDLDKGASFSDKRDRELLKNPITITKVKDFFKNTSTDFDFYFINLKGRKRFAEKGVVDQKFLFAPYPQGLGLTTEQLKNGQINENNITVFFVGNSAAEKIPMTAWTIAHRFGHSIRREYGFNEMTKWLEERFNHVLGLYNNINLYGKYVGGYFVPGEITKAKAHLFNQVGTMRSARQGQIKRYFEFYYELFAQYLKDGKITLNKLNRSIVKGHAAYGRKEMAYTQNIDEVNEILAEIERDFGYYAEDALGNCIGKIYVM